MADALSPTGPDLSATYADPVPDHSNQRARAAGAPAGLALPRWAGTAQLPGWVLLPLRAFLGVTFTYAGLQKLADRHFFDAADPGSIQAQMRAISHHSPIGGLVGAASHQAVVVGLLIALGELAVGLGTLLGLWTRVAAAGGMLLSLSFFLTISFHARPYYYGADIVFLFAWTALLVAGAGGVLSLDARLVERSRRELRLAPAGMVPISFVTVRRLCGVYEKGRCGARDGAPCDPRPCPVLADTPSTEPAMAAELDRRTLLRRAGAAGVVGLGGLVTGGVAAAAGRLFRSSSPASRVATLGQGPPGPASGRQGPTGGRDGAQGTPTGMAGQPASPPGSSGPAAPAATGPPTTPAPPPKGTAVGMASSVPIGSAASFTDPASGQPAYVVRPRTDQFVAFSAICTHQGCTVGFSRSADTFQCPCHGAVFSAQTGQVLQGPATRPLRAITVQEGPDGRLYVDS